jgi:hypothetical protein
MEDGYDEGAARATLAPMSTVAREEDMAIVVSSIELHTRFDCLTCSV